MRHAHVPGSSCPAYIAGAGVGPRCPMGGWCVYTAGVCHGRLVCLHCRRLGQPKVCQERLLSVHCPSLLSDAPSPPSRLRGRPLRALKLRGRLPRQRQGTQRPLRGNPTPITTLGPRHFSRQEDNSLGEEMKDGFQNGGGIRGA